MPIAVHDVPEWLATLRREGSAVVKGCISPERAKHYANESFQWLEDLEFGFKRDDPSTWKLENIQWFIAGGQTNRYGINHEQWVWDIRQEEGIIDKFAQIWETDDLLVSFDGVNISIPIATRKADDQVFKLAAHVDQAPEDTDLHCVQGIINFLPNGPNDGGLMILRGSAALYTEFFDAFKGVPPIKSFGIRDRYDYSDEQMQWFYDRGCRWEKVCCEPGDLMLWDSRTIHCGAAPSASSPRLAAYVCYKPASLATPEVHERRRKAWEQKIGTTHDPITGNNGTRLVPDTHHSYQLSRTRPLQNPQLTKRGRRLLGV